jgi:hypothetical protein
MILVKWDLFVIVICLLFTCLVGDERFNKIIYEGKQRSRKPRPFLGERVSNCSCPSDAPVDDYHQYCGYEIKNKTSNTNLCKDQTKYRCMDPYPWMAIEMYDCTNLRGEKKEKLPIQHCSRFPNGEAPRARECFPPQTG